MKEKKYTYPRVHIERELREDLGETPCIQIVFTSLVVDRFKKENAVQLVAFYPYFGERDVEVEMDSADTFHHMCRESYFAEEEEYEDTDSHDRPLNEVNITFNKDDERW